MIGSLVDYVVSSDEDENASSDENISSLPVDPTIWFVVQTLINDICYDELAEVKSHILPITIDKYREKDIITDSDEDGSESSDDDELITDFTSIKTHQKIIKESKSSGEETDTDFERILEVAKQNRLFTVQKPVKKRPKTKGELQPEDLPPLEKLSITAGNDVPLTKLGNVTSIVGCLIVLKSEVDVPPLDQDSIVFSNDRKAVGQIFDIFGPVLHPMYSVRFNNIDDIKEAGFVLGSPLFFAPNKEQLTKTVFTESLRKIKGSDASWEENNEPPTDIQEFSDDEEEQRYLAKHRRNQNPEITEIQGETPEKKRHIQKRGGFRGRGGGRGGRSRGNRGLLRGSWPPRGAWRGNHQPNFMASPPERGGHQNFYMPPPPGGPNPFIQVPRLPFPNVIDKRFCPD